MSEKLAIFTSQLGAVSETFVRRHVEDLLPGRTLVVARNSGSAFGDFWQVPCPVLYLDRWALKLPVRLARRMGMVEARLRDMAVTKFLRMHSTTVVLGEYLDQFVDFVPLLDRMGLPYVVQGHGIDGSASLRTPGMAKRYLTYASARAVLTRCEAHRQRLIGLGLAAEKVFVNPGGVDVPETVPARGPEAAKRFLAVGRMVPKKGPIYLLEAFRLAAAKDLNITLDYIGDGLLFPAACQFVDACGLGSRVRLHGAAPEETKHRLFYECGVFVQHSIADPNTGDEEGLPAAIQEAMAHGMAAISTRHAGIPEAVEHSLTGWLVEEGDAVGMADEMLFAASNAQRTNAAGRAGHARALIAYRWQDEKHRLLTLISSAK